LDPNEDLGPISMDICDSWI